MREVNTLREPNIKPLHQRKSLKPRQSRRNRTLEATPYLFRDNTSRRTPSDGSLDSRRSTAARESTPRVDPQTDSEKETEDRESSALDEEEMGPSLHPLAAEILAMEHSTQAEAEVGASQAEPPDSNS